MKYPFKFTWTKVDDTLNIKLVNGDNTSDIYIYGMKAKSKVNDETIQAFLDKMYTDQMAMLTEHPIPELEVDFTYDFDMLDVFKKIVSVMDPDTAKTLFISMWGSKK